MNRTPDVKGTQLTSLHGRWAFQVFGALRSLKAKAYSPRRHREHREEQKQKITQLSGDAFNGVPVQNQP